MVLCCAGQHRFLDRQGSDATVANLWAYFDAVAPLAQIAALDPVEAERPPPAEEPSQHTDEAEV